MNINVCRLHKPKKRLGFSVSCATSIQRSPPSQPSIGSSERSLYTDVRLHPFMMATSVIRSRDRREVIPRAHSSWQRRLRANEELYATFKCVSGIPNITRKQTKDKDFIESSVKIYLYSMTDNPKSVNYYMNESVMSLRLLASLSTGDTTNHGRE